MKLVFNHGAFEANVPPCEPSTDGTKNANVHAKSILEEYYDSIFEKYIQKLNIDTEKDFREKVS